MINTYSVFVRVRQYVFNLSIIGGCLCLCCCSVLSYASEKGMSLHPFSVDSGHYVFFSPGTLQFNAMLGSHRCADGTIKEGTWRFAENQWDFVGDTLIGNVYHNGVKCSNTHISPNYDGWIDLFGWATSGWDNTVKDYSAVLFEPWSRDIISRGSAFRSFGYGPSINFKDSDLVGSSVYYDWGQYNEIVNGDKKDPPGLWRTLSQEEWTYLFNRRDTDDQILYGKGSILLGDSSVNGFIILPDDWETPEGIIFRRGMSTEKAPANFFSLEEWMDMEERGAVFFPTSPFRYTDTYNFTRVGGSLAGFIWTSTHFSDNSAIQVGPTVGQGEWRGNYFIPVNDTSNFISFEFNICERHHGHIVRLVKDCVNIKFDEFCLGDSIFWNGKVYNKDGVYSDTIKSFKGYDSVVVLHLILLPTYRSRVRDTICNGSSYFLNTLKCETAGTYVDTVISDLGCDSIITLYLSTLPSYHDTIHDTIFANEDYAWSDSVYTESGIYISTLKSMYGCDSIVTHRLHKMPILRPTSLISSSGSDIVVSQLLSRPNQPIWIFVSGQAHLYLYDIMGRLIKEQSLINGNNCFLSPDVVGNYCATIIKNATRHVYKLQVIGN